MGDEVNPYINAAGGIASSIINTTYNAYQANKQRKWIEEQMQAQRDWDLSMWNKTNEYNAPANQVARMDAAGLNSLYYGLDGSSANAMQAASPIGVPENSTLNLNNPFETSMAAKMHNKQMELMNSEIDKNKETAAGFKLDNEFKDKTMQTRVDAEKLKNDLTKEQKAEIEQKRKESEERIKKMIEESKTEIEKRGLIQTQKWLANAQANQIAEMLPYHKLLMEAETEAQKAAAAASFATAAEKNGLIERGYLDELVKQAKANARSAEANATINEFAESVKTGTLFVYNDEDFALKRSAGKWMNGMIGTISVISQAVGGGLSGVIQAIK